MNFLRLSFVLGAMILCLSSCNTQQNTTAAVGADDRADATSFKSLVGPKWCLPATAGAQDFTLSWNFHDDGTAFFAKTNTASRQIVFNQKKNWKMRAKVLSVMEEKSGVELFKKELSFAMDMATGTRVMTWATPTQPSTCVGNTCSSTSIEAMTLTECE